MNKNKYETIEKLPKGAILGILILLPSIGFLLGMTYQRDIDGKLNLYAPVPVQPFPSTSIPSEQNNTSCQTDNNCTLYNPEMANKTTLCCHNKNMLCTNNQSQIIAVNKTYYQQQIKNTCKPNEICPLYVAVCPANIQQTINQLKAKCIQNVCQVTNK